jgi:hypothetical protein
MTLLTVVDLVITFLLVEVAVLVVWRLATGQGLAVGSLLPMMAAGGFILLALHVALDGGSAWAVMACLACSGVAHAMDVRRRWLLAQPDARPDPAATARVVGGGAAMSTAQHWRATRQ